MSYVLITPIKDESENLPKLIEAIINQTIKPLIWIIVDGGSKDNSFYICKEFSTYYKWIHVIKQKKFFEKGYSHKNFAEAINEGYEYAKYICENEGINYFFIGKVDGTTIPVKEYYEILLREMEKDSKLAITCGIQKIKYNKKIIIIPQSQEIPLIGFNDIRLYRKDFFEKVGGYPLSPSPDTILLIKALNRGWKVKIINKIYFKELRLGGTKIGMWAGYKLKGKTMYMLGYHPLLVFMNAVYYTYKFPPHYQGLALLQGYFLSIIKKERKIDDEEVREYFGKKRLKEIFNAYLGKRWKC